MTDYQKINNNIEGRETIYQTIEEEGIHAFNEKVSELVKDGWHPNATICTTFIKREHDGYEYIAYSQQLFKFIINKDIPVE